MERKSFNDILINVTSLTRDEAEQLTILIKDYPYSQPIHNLAARAAKDNGLDVRENLLHLSSIYTTDRSALKAIMTAPKQVRVENEQPSVAEQVVYPNQNESTDKIIEELMQTINAMHQSMETYELTVKGLENDSEKHIIESTNTIEIEPVTSGNFESEGSPLIDEIKSTKKQIKLENPKQLEQSEIIDRFIESQPSITRNNNAAQNESHDFSESDEQFGANIISETLVEILLKQGKKEKAIEVLKKLIWKFPQKKAYFAAQIEDLKK